MNEFVQIMNFMMYMVMAKFVLNDVPHDMGLFAEEEQYKSRGYRMVRAFPTSLEARRVYGPLKREFSQYEARRIGDVIGVDWQAIDLEQFRMGLAVELEHGRRYPETNVTNDDLYLTGRIAWVHLKEIPDYYTKLLKYVEAG